MKTTKYSLLVLACLFLVIACKPKQPVITIDVPEARLSPTLLGVTSVFMKIKNNGTADDELIGVRTDLHGTVAELHDIQDGKMVKLEKITIPADNTVLLRASRRHIMVYGMPKDAQEGSRFDLTLTFQLSGDRTVHLEITPFSSLKRLHN